MELALSEADQAALAGEIPVGAVIVDSAGQIVCAAGNRKERDADPSAHAEIVAIREACRIVGDGWRLCGHTMVVTLEPCVMCAGAIVAARMERIVFGAFDEKAGGVASVWDVVRDPRQIHRPIVISGFMADRATTQLVQFFAQHRS